MPSRVVTTGMPVRSASSLSSFSAPARVTPWPARMSGRFAQPAVAVVVAGGELDVLRHVDEDGAWPAAARDLEGAAHRRVQLVGVLDEKGVLGEGQRHAHHVRLLEGVFAQSRTPDLARYGDERHGVHLRRCQARDEVRGARAARRDHYAYAVRRPGVAVRGVGGGLLVAGAGVVFWGGGGGGVGK